MKRFRIAILLATLAASGSAHAQKALTDAVNALAEQIVTGLTGGKQRVAVIPLKTLEGEPSRLGAYISEEVGTILATQKVQIIERALLKSVVDEIKLQDTGAIDPATAKRLGKLVGADAIVTGTIVELPTTLRINCRVIATETGQVLAGARTIITIDADVAALIKAKSETSRTRSSTPVPADSPDEAVMAWQQKSVLRFSMDGLHGSGNTLKTTITVENPSGEGHHDYLGPYWLVDENGDRWKGRLPNGRDWDNITIAPGTRRRFQYIFAPETTAIGTKFTLMNEDNSQSLVQDLERLK